MARKRKSLAQMTPHERYIHRRETYKKSHGGLTYEQFRKRQLATIGETRHTLARLRAARKNAPIGPLRLRETVTEKRMQEGYLQPISRLHDVNLHFSRDKGNATNRAIKGFKLKGYEFDPESIGDDSLRGLAVLANTYNVKLGRKNPAYVLAFFNAVVNPLTNYRSNHVRVGGTFITEKAPQSTAAFKEYLAEFSEVVANVPKNRILEWWDRRY